MKSSLVVGLLVAALAIPAFAQLPEPFKQGSYEIKAETYLDITDVMQYDKIPYGGGLGYYFWDNILLGGFFSNEGTEWESYWDVGSVWSLGVFGEYNFDNGGSLIPYVAAAAKFMNSDRDSRDDVIFGLQGSGGLKVFITDRIAISGQIDANFASDGIYDFERTTPEAEKVDGNGDAFSVSATLGIRFFL
jgi:hypothetical protein